MPWEVSDEHLVDMILAKADPATEPVPNVRFNVAKLIAKLAHHVSKSCIQRKLVPTLELLRKDTDQDVKFFARQAIEAIIPN